jgi:DNA-binding MarR family transcriptional regulator
MAKARSVDLKEVQSCMLLRVARLARRARQVYDRHLEPMGLTINQFGLLAHIYAGSTGSLPGHSLGALAEIIGMDPTTLNRNVKPLIAAGLASNRIDPADRRVRIIAISVKGAGLFERAVPLWRAAEREIAQAVGDETLAAMTGLVDLVSLKLVERR